MTFCALSSAKGMDIKMKVKKIAIYIITNIALFIIACITIPKLMKKLTGKLYKKNIKKKNKKRCY